jgi:LPXTG-site transpeptidase (sortase) family protein
VQDTDALAAARAAAIYEEPVEETAEEAAEIERRRRRRSLRGAVAAFLVAILVGILLVVASLTVPLPGAGGRTFSGLAGNPALPSSAGWTTWVVIGAIVLAVLMVGLAIATSEKKGWRWILDTRVIGLIVALALVGYGLTLLFPPGAPFDLSELPGLAGNSLQGTLAQPEDGYPRLKISKVSIDLLLVKGDGKTPPVKYEAYTFPNADHLLAAGNDGNGNSYVYAHARTGMFWRLHDTHIGDTVEVDYGGGKVYRYRVSEIHPAVNWKDLSWLQPTGDDRLTLQTCNGWKDDDPRFIVVARRVQSQTAGNTGQ